MTLQITKKPDTQKTQFLLHQGVNNLLNENHAIKISDFEKNVRSIIRDIRTAFQTSADTQLLQQQLELVLKRIIKTAKSVSGIDKTVTADDFFLTYYGGTPKEVPGIETRSFDLIVERAPTDNVVVIFGQPKSTPIFAEAILSEAEDVYGAKCSQASLWYSIDPHLLETLPEPTHLYGDDYEKDTSNSLEIGRIYFDKTHKLKLNADPTKHEIWGKVREKFSRSISVNDIVTLVPPEDKYNPVIARIAQIQTHQQHSSNDFSSYSDLSTEVKLIPLREKIENKLEPISNKQFRGFYIRFPSTEERYLIHGMSPQHGLPYGSLIMDNGREIPAYYAYDSELSALDKTPYLSRLFFGLQNSGKSNALAYDIRCVTTCEKIPPKKRPAVIIIDGENSFLNFPQISEMTPESQKYLNDNGLGEINHQVLSISNRLGEGDATLSFNELEVSAWHNMLPSLTAKTEGQLISILEMTFNMLRREGREITTEAIRHYAMNIAEASNMIHRSQIPAIARALQCPELDLFDDTNLNTVLNPDVLFKPGLVSTINVNGLDMNRRRVVTLYILELLHRYKVINRTDEPGVIVAVDECENLYPHKPTAREREFVDRIAERTAAVTMLGRKRYYGLYLVSHLTSDVSPQVVQLVSDHMAFRCSGGEDRHISTYIGHEYVDEINSLQTGFCRMKTNTSTVVQSGTNAVIKFPFVGRASELTITTETTTGDDNVKA